MSVPGLRFSQTVTELQSLNAAHNLPPVDILKTFTDVNAAVAQGTLLKAANMNVGMNSAIIAGGAAGAHTVTGILTGDRLVKVYHISTAAAIATMADLTSEFTISAANTINNATGTDTTNDQLLVFYERSAPSGAYQPWRQDTDHASLIAGVCANPTSVDTDTQVTGLVRVFGPVQKDKLLAWTGAAGATTAAPNAAALAQLAALGIFPL